MKVKELCNRIKQLRFELELKRQEDLYEQQHLSEQELEQMHQEYLASLGAKHYNNEYKNYTSSNNTTYLPKQGA